MPVVSGRFEHVPVCIFLLFLSCGGSTTSASASESATAPDNSKVEHFADASQPARRVRIGLALGGGGTRGAAHVRVIKELERSGVPIDFIAGTSMGAIVGGLYSAGVSTEQIERKFENQSLMRSFMTVPLWIRIAIAPVLLAPRFLGHKPYDGLYYGNKFRNYLRQSVPPDSHSLEALKVPFGAVALNIADGKISCLRTGDLATAMQASSAVPGLRKPVQIGTELYTDGGVAVNLPVKQVREMGADFVIAVCVDERIKRTPLDNFRKVGSVAQRVVNLQLESIDKVQGQDADVLIHPEVDGIGLISTNVADARKALDAGTAAILEAMPQIKAKLSERGFHVGVASTDTIH